MVKLHDLHFKPFISELKTDQPTFLSELQFRTPIASIVVNASDLYIVDDENKRVVIFPRGFEPSNSFGGFNSPKGRLTEPVKIAKDGDNLIKELIQLKFMIISVHM